MGQEAYFFWATCQFQGFLCNDRCWVVGVFWDGTLWDTQAGFFLEVFLFLISFLNMWNQTKRISKINILPDPPKKNAGTSTPKCLKLRRCMKYSEKIIFSHFLGAAASHIAQKKRFVVRIPRAGVSLLRQPPTVPDVQWVLCCNFGIDTRRWLNHLWKYS